MEKQNTVTLRLVERGHPESSLAKGECEGKRLRPHTDVAFATLTAAPVPDPAKALLGSSSPANRDALDQVIVSAQLFQLQPSIGRLDTAA